MHQEKTTGKSGKAAGTRWLLLAATLAAFCAATVLPGVSQAQILTNPEGTCTLDPQFNPQPTVGSGIITNIVTQVENALTDPQEKYEELLEDASRVVDSIRAALTLYIIVFGILFTFGMVQITFHDFALRILKIALIVVLTSENGWTFFNDNVVTFFNDGTDEIIAESIEIVSGSGGGDPLLPAWGDAPFGPLDNVLKKVVSAKMIVTMAAIFFTGPYGAIFEILLLMAMASFLRVMLTVVWVYLMALVIKTLMFGLAPIFIGFALFNRTRYLFDGWLNVIVNACLQPIMLMMFLAFFIMLIDISVTSILQNPVCWTEAKMLLRGTPFDVHYWRFMIQGANGWEPYGGEWDFNGAGLGNQSFPIPLMTILTFLVLSQLMDRFAGVVMMIAGDLASASTNLSHFEGALSNWFSNVKQHGIFSTEGSTMRPGSLGGRAGGARQTGLSGSDLTTAQERIAAAQAQSQANPFNPFNRGRSR